MICPVCGRNAEHEEARFCEYCGAALRADGPMGYNYNADQGNPYGSPANMPPVNQRVNPATVLPQEAPVSFGSWLGTMLLPFIPIVGSMIYLVMLLVWAFGGSANETKRNWARASLVVSLISTVLLIFAVVALLQYATVAGYYY
ncbi:zinc ribbon domain-containing protein [Anaerolentibacter hominis]|uniref:zinc ribbon domain-containing protein n=1 Tax=Anaerolentibacter hominis TaxID=3079009 RepID=UPI0031B8A799